MKSNNLIVKPSELNALLAVCRTQTLCSFDTETTGLDPMSDTIVGYSLATDDWAAYIPVGHVTGEKQMDFDAALDAIAPLLEDSNVVKVMHNAAFDISVMAQAGVRVRNYEDTQLMSYTLDGQRHRARGHGFDALCKFHFDHDTIQFGDVVKPEFGVKNFAHVRLRDAAAYAAEDAEWTLRLYHQIRHQLDEEGLLPLYEHIDRPVPGVLSVMKRNGLLIDWEHLSRLRTAWGAERAKAEAECRSAGAGHVNLGSPKAVGKLLYETLKLPIPDDLDPEDASTGKEALATLTGRHPIIEPLKRFKEYDKLLSSFCDAWPQFRKPDDRIHANYNPTTTATGRLSGSTPNMQQVPTRTERGAELRKAVIAAPGRSLISIDYSQLEYRVLAHITKAPALIDAFHRGQDLHATMAALVRGGDWQDYNNKKDKARYKIRTTFKNVNFAVIYGAGPPKVARMSEIELDEALEILEAHRELCPEVYTWKEEVIEFARENKYSETIFGRRIHVPHIRHGSKFMRGSAERLAINGVVQGSATGDMIRLAMPAVRNMLRLGVHDAKLLASVHDELLLDADTGKAEAIAKLVAHEMEHCADDFVTWRVPIVAEIGIGKNWHEAK